MVTIKGNSPGWVHMFRLIFPFEAPLFIFGQISAAMARMTVKSEAGVAASLALTRLCVQLMSSELLETTVKVHTYTRTHTRTHTHARTHTHTRMHAFLHP